MHKSKKKIIIFIYLKKFLNRDYDYEIKFYNVKILNTKICKY